MKGRFLILVFTLICLTTMVYSVSVCECNDNITQGYRVEKECSKCPRTCNKIDCIKYRVVDGGNHDFLMLPIMQCQTPRGNSKSSWYTLNVQTVCDKPQIFFGCFRKIYYSIINTTYLVNSSCRTSFDYQTECSESWGYVECVTTPEIKSDFPEYGQIFKIHDPVTFNHFNLIGPRYNYWTPNADSQQELYENLSDMKNKKDNITIQEIVALMHHSKDSYNQFSNSQLQGFDSIYNSDKNIYIELGYDNTLKAIIIAFRGSWYLDNEGNMDLSNFITDAQDSQISAICSECSIHKGFYSSYTLIEEELRKKIIRLQEAYNGGLIFTGHSMGGALATIACISLNRFQSLSSSSLITFGSPRVGNDKFASHVNTNVYGKNFRVTYQSDPVTRVPSTPKYHHVGTQIDFSNSNTYSVHEKYLDESGNEYTIKDIRLHSGYWLISS